MTLLRDRRGGVAILVAAGLPILLGLTAFAVDLGAAAIETRKLQGIADAAAIAAASNPDTAQASAQAAVDAAHWPRAIQVNVTTGSYTADAALTPAQRFTPGGSSPDAAKVTLATPSPTYFARIFGQTSIPIARSAIAAQTRLAAFSIGSRLASVNGGIINGYLGALTGSSVSLSVADYNALAGADIDLFGLLDALHTNAGLSAVDYQHILDAQVTTAQALNAAAATTSDATTAAALRTLASQSGNRTVLLGSLFNIGSYGSASSGSAGLVKLNAMALATALLQLAAPSRQVSFDAAAGLPGIASTRITIAIGERPAQSPWVTVTNQGTPIIRTAQVRLYTEATLTNVALPLVGAVAIKLPVYVELASAEARLNSIACTSDASRSVGIDARPNPGQAAIAALDKTKLGDFSTPLALSNATLIDTLLIDVDGRAVIDTGAAESWQTLHFAATDISSGTPQTVESSKPVSGIAASLVSNLALTVRVIGLPISTAALTGALTPVLTSVAPALDQLLGVATGTLGVHYGEADVRVTGIRCGTAALVG